MVRVAFEKAGLARAGSPLVTQNYDADVEDRVAQSAALAGAPLAPAGPWGPSQRAAHAVMRNRRLSVTMASTGTSRPASASAAMARPCHEQEPELAT